MGEEEGVRRCLEQGRALDPHPTPANTYLTFCDLISSSHDCHAVQVWASADAPDTDAMNPPLLPGAAELSEYFNKIHQKYHGAGAPGWLSC